MTDKPPARPRREWLVRLAATLEQAEAERRAGAHVSLFDPGNHHRPHSIAHVVRELEHGGADRVTIEPGPGRVRVVIGAGFDQREIVVPMTAGDLVSLAEAFSRAAGDTGADPGRPPAFLDPGRIARPAPRFQLRPAILVGAAVLVAVLVAALAWTVAR